MAVCLSIFKFVHAFKNTRTNAFNPFEKAPVIWYFVLRTRKAMSGSVSFKMALSERLSIIKCSREQVNKMITDQPPQLTPGIK